MTATLFFLFGLVLLYLGGEALVKGAVSLALKLKISTFVAGMTIVSFATSAPELLVSLGAAIKGHTDITFGNVIGSNIANIALVLGLAAVLFRLNINPQTKRISFPFLFFSSLIFGLVVYFFNGIYFWVGVAFVILLVFFILYLIRQSRKEYLQTAIVDDELFEKESQTSLYKSVLYLVIGIVFLKYGADYFVDGAIALAEVFSVSNRVIAVTVIAIGTSIPELATTVIAAIKKEESLAVGNLIGSNIFNILAVLGLTALIKDIPLVDVQLIRTDYLLMMGITIFLGVFIYLFSKNKISRKEGAFFLAVYIAYIIYTFSFRMA
ncbi:MAG TPA: calcium/sodium antiporter [Flavobacteriales bacterium]|jgi:cation:H+ antiporter|nr:calcium/sodium antiporter [Flavobacteriales bacterium]|tara:strand:- start:4359 stop:5327 length:969 start_codon:yes stop_codon:yes gene_type:complete